MRLVESGRRFRESENKPFGILTDDEFLKLAYGSPHKYLFSDIVDELIADNISKDTGIDFDVKYGTLTGYRVNGLSFRISDYGSYSELLSAVQSKIGSGDDFELKKMIDFMSYIFDYLSVDNGKISIKSNPYASTNLLNNAPVLFELLYYGETGDHHNDSVYGHELSKTYLESLGDDSSIAYAKFIDVPELNVSVRFYLNGRVDVKGLSQDAWDRINKLADDVKAYGRKY